MKEGWRPNALYYRSTIVIIEARSLPNSRSLWARERPVKLGDLRQQSKFKNGLLVKWYNTCLSSLSQEFDSPIGRQFLLGYRLMVGPGALNSETEVRFLVPQPSLCRCSSTGLEQLSSKQKVEGSSPSIGAKVLYRVW